MAFPTGWTKYQVITLPAVKTLTNVPYLLTNLPAAVYTGARSDGGDIRFTTSDGSTQLARQIVAYNSGAQTCEIYVNVPSLSATVTSDIRIYYGAASETEPAANSTYGSQNVWDANFKAVYHLQEAVNNDADGYKDSTSNANHMTGTSMAIAAPAGLWGGLCAQFDGSADYITRDGITFDPEVGYSLIGWIKHAALSTAKMAFALGYPAINCRSDVGLYNNGSLRLLLRNNAGGNVVNSFGYGKFDDDAWHQLGQVFNPSGSRWEGVTDGAYGTGGTPGPWSAISFDSILAGGTNTQSTPVPSWDGLVDEIRLSTIPRSADWVYTENYMARNLTAPTYGGEVGIGGVSLSVLMSNMRGGMGHMRGGFVN